MTSTEKLLWHMARLTGTLNLKPKMADTDPRKETEKAQLWVRLDPRKRIR